MVDALADEYDPRQIALAAIRLAHDEVRVDEAEIPQHVPKDRVNGRTAPTASPGARRPGSRAARCAVSTVARKTRLFIGLGRNDRIRPGDLVGAIANESDLEGRDIGPIKIGDRFSTVDVPEAAADAVIAAIKQTTIRGKRATIRRDRYQHESGSR